MSEAFDLGGRRYFDLREVPTLFAAPDKVLRLLMLADNLHPANVVQDHIRSFSEFSTHCVSVVNTRSVKRPDPATVSDYDALLIHYSIFVIAETYLSEAWQEFISRFPGPVAVIHEDEYQRIDAFTQKFAELGVQAVFSCLDSKETLERVYGKSALPRDTLFFCCLPGYVVPQLLCTSPPPISERPFDIIYRGRTLRPELGRFAQEKRQIGEQVLAVAPVNGLICDISSAEEDRIYGSQWQQFLMSGKAMLGVEGGASIFDFDGAISEAVAAYEEAHPYAEFDEIWTSVLAKHEGNIEFRTITPKFFEAIAAKTVLVLYPGKYSNVLIPNRHFIPLERDGSNIADVVAKLKDVSYLQEMADRTYKEILPKAELGTKFYVNQIDRVLYAIANSTPISKLLKLDIAGRLFQYQQQQQLALTQAGLAATQTELASTQAGLAATQTELASTQAGLAATQTELASTQAGLAATQTELAFIHQELNMHTARLDLVHLKLEDLHQKVLNEALFAELFVKMLRSKIKRFLGLTK